MTLRTLEEPAARCPLAVAAGWGTTPKARHDGPRHRMRAPAIVAKSVPSRVNDWKVSARRAGGVNQRNTQQQQTTEDTFSRRCARVNVRDGRPDSGDILGDGAVQPAERDGHRGRLEGYIQHAFGALPGDDDGQPGAGTVA